MTESADERLRRLRHDLASPLSVVLAEAQLLLMNPDDYDAETIESLREIEKAARRMRQMLQES